MEKFITDERTGLRYELVGDYYLIAGEDEPEGRPIGVWGQRHRRYLKKHRRVRYYNLLTAGALNSYLTEIELQAQALFNDIVMRLSEEENVAENLKVTAPTEPLPEQSDVHQPPLGTS